MANVSFSAYTITNWERRYFALRYLVKMEEYTDLSRTPLTIIENGDNPGDKDLEQWLKITSGVTNFEFKKLEERHGLARVWNLCMATALYDWVLICNDDCVPEDPWEWELGTMTQHFNHKMFLLCHPNGFSGFCLHRPLWYEVNGFNGAFTEGYFEDDDFFLKVCFKYGIKKKQEAMKKLFFSYYDNYGDSMFSHQPHKFFESKNPVRKWDKKVNLSIFNRYWKEVENGTEYAIENKNGRFFVPVAPS